MGDAPGSRRSFPARSERPARVSAAIQKFPEMVYARSSVGVTMTRHTSRCGPETKLIHLDWLNILPISLNDSHLQTGILTS